ncbi:MAG: hypothetical protein ACI4D4_10295 [Lachnospira sp.]
MIKVIYLIVCMVLLSMEDIKYKSVKVLHFVIMFGCIPFAFIGDYIFFQLNFSWQSLLYSVLTGGGMFIISKVTGSFGTADGIVVSLIGIITDWKMGISVLLLSMLLISFFGLILLAVKKVKLKQEIPYIPFLLISLMGVLLGG